ncbi:hypothetical protein BGY98DRAFT_956279 [Russula aff. rugulosa BPL654]|nr:hypothetical protein BGY98DRAFT_956279 [Russula aff. rugulosa BPL654]
MPSNTDNITLVAPRPVRLTNFSIHLPSPHRQYPLRIASAPTDPDDRLYSADSPLDDDALLHLDPDSKSPKASPRASPRYPISSLHERTLTLPSKPLSGIDNLSVLPRDDSRTPVKQLGAPVNSRAPPLRENEENDMRPETPSRFFSSGPLASPISRIHTRNPFQRHTSYETSLVPAPYLPQDRALSPASVALPSPTPSELESI